MKLSPPGPLFPTVTMREMKLGAISLFLLHAIIPCLAAASPGSHQARRGLISMIDDSRASRAIANIVSVPIPDISGATTAEEEDELAKRIDRSFGGFSIP